MCSGLCKVIAWFIVVIAVILKIIGIFMVRYYPSGHSDSWDRKRYVGITLILTAIIMFIVSIAMFCCAYGVNICKWCKKKSHGSGQQIIIIQGPPQPSPQPAAQNVRKYNPPPPPPQPSPGQLPHPFGQQYFPSQQPLGFPTVPQYWSQSNPNFNNPQYGPSSFTNSQFVQHYDLSQPSQNSGFLSPPQPNQLTFYPTHQQPNPVPLDVQQKVNLPQHPPSYEH
ncbi:unnamed protein product [Rodentolepis nana]|uniref:Uncharacterized protein n=1 Tax=Rodentolepis nana TaxID=102285 RepID=A0A0R3TZU4_RODNA|nr:unnamed protein product [Rodentolepis nana]